MEAVRSPVITLIVLLEANHGLHIHPMHHRPRLHIGKIKEIPIVGDDDRGPDLLDVGEEAAEEGGLVGFVEDGEEAWVVGLGGVLKIFNVLTDNVSIGDQVALQTHVSQVNTQWRRTWPLIM